MLPSLSRDETDQVDFKWGIKGGRGGKKNNAQFYKSFTFDGVEYFLYDSVYLSTEKETIPHIGKLIKIFELAGKLKKVKVLWFFRPSEVSSYLGDVEVHPKEIFLASGVGNGLTNVNPLETIAGKCNVICMSKDERNRQPLPEEVNMADHIFFRTFDVEKLTFSNKLGEKIADTDVKLLLNKSVPETYCPLKIDSYYEPNSGDKVDSKEEPVLLKSDAIKNVHSGVGSDLLPGKDLPPVEASLDIRDNSPTATSNGEAPSQTAALAMTKAQTVNTFSNSVAEAVGTALQSVEKGTTIVSHAGNIKSVVQKGVAAGTLRSADDHDGCPSEKGETPIGDLLKLPSSTSVSSDRRESDISKDSQRRNEQSTKRKYADGHSVLDTRAAKTTRIDNEQRRNAPNLAVDTDRKIIPSKSAVPVSEVKMQGTVTQNLSGASLGLSKMIKNEDKITRPPNDKLWKTSLKQMSEKRVKVYGQEVEVTRRPNADGSKWFTNLAWEDRVKDANTEGSLVLLQNLDSNYSSSDVEDIVWHGFGESCSAKVMAYTTKANPPRARGQALIIMKTKEAAERVVRQLQEGCLLLQNGWPLIGRTIALGFLGKQTSFPGHLVIDRIRLQLAKENKEAVATSHSAQSNTLEYDMAMEWRLLQERYDNIYTKLFKRQREQLQDQKGKLKTRGH